jgi:hypothetical protein
MVSGRKQVGDTKDGVPSGNPVDDPMEPGFPGSRAAPQKEKEQWQTH